MAVHLYRPFSAKHFLAKMPKTVKRIAVLDRTKEPGSNGEPLYLDVKDVFYGQENAPLIVGGRYGLGSKDTTPAQILSVYENLELPMPKDHFTIGIVMMLLSLHFLKKKKSLLVQKVYSKLNSMVWVQTVR